jgi:HlyD family secretion protein
MIKGALSHLYAFSASPPRRRAKARKLHGDFGLRRGRVRWVLLVSICVTLAGMAGAAALLARSNALAGAAAADARTETEEVKQGKLLITVTEKGSVESASNIDIKCQVLGGSTILWIIPDGTEVQKGAEIVRLDASTIEDQVNAQKIVYEKVQATRIQAEKTFSSAELAVQEYLEGTYVKELQLVEAQITIALENLRSAENSLVHTERMARKGYVTPLQRDAQVFAVQRCKLDLDTAQTAKTVLQKFTKAKLLKDFEAARDTAEAQMRSEQAAFELEEARLKRLQAMLLNCVITAPQDGMVVYANENSGRFGGSSSVKIEEGASVREKQSLVRLPDLSQMQVKVTIHESKVEQLRSGMRARVSVQGRELQGTVTSVANQPEALSFSMANVKTYATVVKIDGEQKDLKPGMTAEVEILIADLENVIAVPVQAIVEEHGKFLCLVKGEVEPRQVQIGLSNTTKIEIVKGLYAGDQVLLNPRKLIAAAKQDSSKQGGQDVEKKFGKSKGGVGKAGVQGGNGPGKTSGPEQASTGNKGGQGFSVAQFDKNGDNKISREEAPERMQENFEKIDTNGDGQVDAGELAAMRSRRAQSGKSPGGQGGPETGGQGPDGAPGSGALPAAGGGAR